MRGKGRGRPRALWAVASTLGLLLSGIWTLAVPAPASAGPPILGVAATGTPALALDAPDPDMVRDGATLYAFTTGTTWGNQIGIAETTSSNPETGWTTVGSAFPQVPFFDPLAPWEMPETTTSPGVFHFNGHWIMYYDANVVGSGRTCLSEATSVSGSVTGPYVDSSTAPIECQLGLGGSLDPQPFVDPATGQPYLLWKSNDGSSASPSQVWSQPLDATGTRLIGSASSIFTIDSANYPWETATDDPSMVYDGGNYYLFFSSGDFRSNNYVIGYTLCAGPNGGCDENPLPDSNFILNGPGGTGGGMVFPTGGSWWVSYQTWAPSNCTNYPCTGNVREMFVALTSLPPPPLPTITTSALPPAGDGSPYAQTLSASSGVSPYVWSITSGQLPQGLSLSATTGVISGSPTVEGTKSVTFEVADAERKYGDKDPLAPGQAGFDDDGDGESHVDAVRSSGDLLGHGGAVRRWRHPNGNGHLLRRSDDAVHDAGAQERGRVVRRLRRAGR